MSSQSSQRRDENLPKQVFDVLPDDLYDKIKNLPYASRALIKRWYEREANRLAPLMLRVTGVGKHGSPVVNELLELTTSKSVDLLGVDNWLKDHREELSGHLLVELVSAAMVHGVTQSMIERNDIRHDDNREMKYKALQLWHNEYMYKRMSKESAAARIALAVGLKPSTVRGYLKGLRKDPGGKPPLSPS